MSGALLEREEHLDRLGDALAAAEQGRGSEVAVGGEAGIGNTSLVRPSATRIARVSGSGVLLGACDETCPPRAR